MGLGMLLVVVVLPTLIGYNFYELLGYGKELGPYTQGCTLLGKDGLAVEDLVAYSEQILIGGAGSVIYLAEHSPEKTPPGYLVAVDARGGEPKLSKLEMKNLPKEWAFHPHGLFYSAKTSRLYVINHGGHSTIGTRIELFSVTEGKDGLPVLTWVMAVAAGHRFGNVMLNSVVEGKENEIYVTQWKNFPVPEHGDHFPQNLLERFHKGADFTINLANTVGLTGVHRCTFDVETKTTIKCSMVISGTVAANGITINKERNTLYVNDPPKSTIYIYAVKPNGDLTLQGKIKTPHAVDNIHQNPETGEICMGTIPKIFQYLEPGKPNVEGTFLSAKPNKDGSFSLTDEVVHDASLLNQISACDWINNGKKRWAVCGGPNGAGILICPK